MKTETYNKHEHFAVVGTYDVMNKPPKPGERGSFCFVDRKHTPQNKIPGSVESRCELTVTANEDGHNSVDTATAATAPVKGWTEIRMEETTVHNGRQARRVISVTLHHDARKALLEYLLATEG